MTREDLLQEGRRILHSRNLLLRRLHRIAVDTKLTVNVRLSAIAFWTEPWCHGPSPSFVRPMGLKKENTK